MSSTCQSCEDKEKDHGGCRCQAYERSSLADDHVSFVEKIYRSLPAKRGAGVHRLKSFHLI
jgi:hypothetical protein